MSDHPKIDCHGAIPHTVMLMFAHIFKQVPETELFRKACGHSLKIATGMWAYPTVQFRGLSGTRRIREHHLRQSQSKRIKLDRGGYATGPTQVASLSTRHHPLSCQNLEWHPTSIRMQ